MSIHCNDKISRKSQEKVIQHRLYCLYGGEKEKPTLVGNIDLLTNTEIIEIKALNNWKAALGQVLAYSYFYPLHKKRIHLFGKTYCTNRRYREEICTSYDVIVTYEDIINSKLSYDIPESRMSSNSINAETYGKWLNINL